VEYYQGIVDAATSVSNQFQPLKNILNHLAACGPSELEPILIHCSLGKDRTGVICALILSICGVEDSIVGHEYALTAVGIEDKIASIIAEIRPDGPGISKEEDHFFGSRLVNLDHPLVNLDHP
jgi:protein tyrosine phosphatase